MSKMPKGLVAASSRMVILAILSRGSNYGYQILQTIKHLTEGGWVWKDGMLYPVLHKMEKEKLIKSHWEEPANGPSRKYYEITELGLRQLKVEKEEWRFTERVIHNLCGMEICLS
jgi:PadR family transcriptional regulator, regulatory protein PadR